MNMDTGGFGGDDRRKYLVPALIIAAALVVLLLIFAIVALVRSRSAAGNPTATISRTATRGPITVGSPTISGTPRASTAPSASASARPSNAPSAAPSTAPSAGKAYVVANTGGDNVNMRATAAATGEIVARLAPGDQLTEIGPVANADGREWRHVRTSDGIEGWIASEFTAPAP